jgi:adenylosuccinate synthase
MTDKSGGDKDDDLHKKFREALDRKKEQHESHPGTGARREGVGDARNDKRQRQFRRKSG